MAAYTVYEATVGLNIDIPLVDSEGEQVTSNEISFQKIFVKRPGATAEEEWSATVVAPNILRHTVPEGANLTVGPYRLQPYIETIDGYKGRCKTVMFNIVGNFK
jgi:hypothetical protein